MREMVLKRHDAAIVIHDITKNDHGTNDGSIVVAVDGKSIIIYFQERNRMYFFL